MNTYTINLKTENSEQFDAFLFFIKSFGLIESLEIKKENVSKKEKRLNSSSTTQLVLPPLKNNNALKYYGIWEEKNIIDIKQYRDNLWQR